MPPTDPSPRLGIFLPPMGAFSEPSRIVELAVSAEEAGWDGLFLWDHILAFEGFPVTDAWTTLAAVAAATNRIRFGPLVTPLARRRPWVLARQIVTLDRLSNGRLTLGVGLGDDGWREFSAFGEVTDPKARGDVLDESLALLRALLEGEPVKHRGERYQIDSPAFLPKPVQPRLPIWGACRWPHRQPVARAAALDGIFPIFDTPVPPPPPSPEDVAAVRAAVDVARSRPASDPFDVAVRFPFGLEDPASLLRTIDGLAAAGATWILDSYGPDEPPPEVVEAAVKAGPPPTPAG